MDNPLVLNILKSIYEELQAIHAQLAAQPQQQPAAATDSQTVTFTADVIAYGISEDGKPIYKALGGRYSKWGVRIWPEVLPLLIDPKTLQPGRNLLNPPLTLRVEMGENGPRKVTGKA